MTNVRVGLKTKMAAPKEDDINVNNASVFSEVECISSLTEGQRTAL